MSQTKSRTRRLLAVAAVVASLVVGVSVLVADPALAVSVSSSGLSVTAGHICKDIGDYPLPGGQEGQADICVELGFYKSASGQASIVAQTEARCQDPNGTYTACSAASGVAAPFDPTDAAVSNPKSLAEPFSCTNDNPECPGSISYFSPIPNVNNTHYFISPGQCLNNVWAVVFSGTSVTMPVNVSGNPGSLSANLTTSHYTACESTSGAGSFSL